MKTTKDVWDGMSPEERAKCPFLQYLNKDILNKPWDELPRFAQDHIALMLPLSYHQERKEDKNNENNN